jgi:hypothetical protein
LQDQLRIARDQLTDVLLKISDARINYQENGAVQGDSVIVAKSKKRARGAIRDRLDFLCNQAEFLVEQIPGRVTAIEYALIGLACEDADDLASSEMWTHRSLSVSTTQRKQAYDYRTLARLCFKTQRVSEGRDAFAKACTLLSEGTDDGTRNDLVETYLRWADIEESLGDRSAVPAIISRAANAAASIVSTPRKLSAEEAVVQRRDVSRTTVTPGADGSQRKKTRKTKRSH